MPDVTGGPPPQLGAVVGAAPGPEEAQVSVGQVGKAPDILRTEPPLGTGSGLPARAERGQTAEKQCANLFIFNSDIDRIGIFSSVMPKC